MNVNDATQSSASPGCLLAQQAAHQFIQNTLWLPRLCLLVMLLWFANPSFSKSVDCRYQLSNWSDEEAHVALKQWTTNDSQPPIVQYGTVLTQMPPSQCKAFKRWLANAEMLKSSYRLSFYYGKHPKKHLDNNRLFKTQSDISKTHSKASQRTSYRLSPGVELNINQQLWREGITPNSTKTSAIFIDIEQQNQQTDKKDSATMTPLSRKPASQSPKRWVSIAPATPKEPRFSFTVFIQDQSTEKVSYKNNSASDKKIFVRIQQWHFDAIQDQWLETRAKRKVVTLNQWHSLATFFAEQDKSTNNNRHSTKQRNPHAKYYFYIDRPQ